MHSLDDRDPVDVLAEDFADRLRRGEHPSVSDYAIAHPDYADQLRELLPAVAQMESLRKFRKATAPADGKEHLPDRFGDFRIIREVGRGGMGVVFEAVQESLGRPVALKVLATHAQLDETRRERFIREAQAAAKLHHTNIVPVFGVGEQDGLPYYVMQLIRGGGVNEVVRRWRWEQGKEKVPAGSTQVNQRTDNLRTPRVHTPGSPPPSLPEIDAPKYEDWNFVAEIALQAADALHYAHKQGVLHRDVKPANLILDPTGRVWVTDFGLAKMVELHGLTASGDILGTLQYVAPECLSGDADARSDVYGLGATLYELLTLEPPYPIDTPAKLIKQVADSDPIPPRQLNPDIPHDLETIVLKAMAREPEQRYTTAREFARDLQAFLDDRPIKARRQTAFGRTWRWCRRNPAIAMLTVNLVAALVLAGIVGWVGYAKTKRALAAEAAQLEQARRATAEADQARQDAEQLSAKLEANLKLSLEAFEQVFEATGGNQQGLVMRLRNRTGGPGGFPGGPGGPGGPGTPGGGPAGPGGPGGGPNGPGGGPLGPGAILTNEATERAAILEAILTFYDRFAEQNATHPRLQLESAKARRRVGEAQVWLGQTDKAAASFRRAIAQLDELTRKNPNNESFRAELVQAYLLAPPELFGNDTEKVMHEAVKLARTLTEGPNLALAGSLSLKVASLRHKAGDRAGAETAYQDAIAGLAAPPHREDDRPVPIVAEQALARFGLARLYAEAGRLRDARRLLEVAIDELRRVAERPGPQRPPREIVGQGQGQLIEVLDKLGEKAAADRVRKESEWFGGFGSPGGFGGPGGGGGPFPGGPKGKDQPPKKN